MVTIYELQLIDGFTMDVIKKMLPFVIVAESKEREKLRTSNVFKYGRHKLIGETSFLLQDQKAYKPDTSNSENGVALAKYAGNKMSYKTRYRFHYKDQVFAGLTVEKDAGEAFNFKNSSYGFDFYSAHIQLNNLGVFKRLTIGDFQAKFGQGLILWTGFGMGKSLDVLNIRKKGQGIRYYTSTNENNFMRGVGTTIKLGKFEFTTFFSHKKIDANLKQANTLESSEEQLTAFQNSGYHRTLSEIENRKAVDESIIGAKLGFAHKIFKISANFVGYKYGVDLLPSDAPYKLYDFDGESNLNASFDYQIFYKKMSFFGESAVGKNGAIAVQNGMVTSLVPQISFSLLHRYYQKDYHAYYSNSFSENSRIVNEQGVFYGLEFQPVSGLKIAAYADFFEFPWLKFGVDAPSNGNEYFVQASYSFSRNVDMHFRWRTEIKAGNFTNEGEALRNLENGKKEQYRYHISYRVSDLISLRSRIEVASYQQADEKEYGYMFLQDLNFSLRRLPISFYLRYAVFDAPYNARLYAYENDVLNSFSVPAYSGKGSRVYVMIKYSLAEFIDLRIRYSHFFYPGNAVIGSGLSEIQGDLKSELKLQVVVRF